MKNKDKNYTTFKSHRSEPYFSLVKTGKKTVEARIRKGKYLLIKPGDHIVVYNENETEQFEVVVKRVSGYLTFADLLENEGLSKVMPDVATVSEGESIIFNRFYTKEQEKKFGTLAIEVATI